MKEKVIGILGGMGPYATVDLFRKIIEETPAAKDWEHLRIIVDNNPKIPSRTRAVLLGEADPTPMLIETARNLERAGADFIVMPCNSAHIFYPALSKAIGIPVLNIIEETVEYIVRQSPGIKAVSLLAAKIVVDASLYQDRFKKKGVTVILPSEEQQKTVREAIEEVKLDKVTETVKYEITGLIHDLARRGAQAAIAGCTEISILLKELRLNTPVFDSNEILARQAVKKAKNM